MFEPSGPFDLFPFPFGDLGDPTDLGDPDDFGDPTPAEYVIVDSFLYAIYSIVYGMFCFTPVLFYFWGKYSALAMAASSDALKRVSDRVSDSKLEEGKKEGG